MIILYIPFDTADTDLVRMAEAWQASLLGRKNVIIYQYNNPANQPTLPDDELFVVYVLGHGHPDALPLGNIGDHSDRATSSFLSINEITERYSHDLTLYAHQIKSARLYFCNPIGNEKEIAEQFKQAPINSETRVDYYKGTLSRPTQYNINSQDLDNKEYKYAINGNEVVRVAKARSILPVEKPTDDEPVRTAQQVKDNSFSFGENRMIKKRLTFFQKIKNKRGKELTEYRCMEQQPRYQE